MDRHQRLVKRPGHRLGCLQANVQTSDQPRPLRDRDRIDLLHRTACLLQSLIDHHGDVFHMDAAGHFRDDTAKFFMYVDL